MLFNLFFAVFAVIQVSCKRSSSKTSTEVDPWKEVFSILHNIRGLEIPAKDKTKIFKLIPKIKDLNKQDSSKR